MDGPSPPSAPRQPGVGDILEDRYELLEELGRGTSAVVFRAHDRGADEAVAVKLLTVELAGAADLHERVRRELRTAWKVTHPHILRIHDMIVVGGRIALTMEYVAGETLHQRLQRGKLSIAEARQLALDLSSALAAAHAAGAIHRDLKPANILLRAGSGQAVVADFGLARLGEMAEAPHLPQISASRTPAPTPPPSSESSTSATLRNRPLDLTREGALIGTPVYMAPEQLLRRSDVGPAADVYAIGLILYEGLSGKLPHRDQTLEEITYLRLSQKVRPVERLRPDTPRQLARAIARCLESDVAQRFANGGELMTALRSALLDPGERRRRRRQLFGVALLALAVSLVLASVAVVRDRQRRTAVCRGAADRLLGVWDATTRSGLQRAFARFGPATEAPAASVDRTISAWTEQWVKERTEACEATRLRNEQPEALMTQRFDCLDVRLEELRALVHELERADRSTLESATQSAAGLPSVSDCSMRLLRQRKAESKEVAGLRPRLAAIRALDLTGQAKRALPLLDELLTQARRFDQPGLIAELLIERAGFSDALGDYDRGRRDASQAYALAYRSQEDQLAGEAAQALTHNFAGREDTVAVHEWSEVGRAALARAGLFGGVILAELERADAWAFHLENDARSIDHARRALALYEAALPPDSPQIGAAHSTLATAYQGRGEAALARRHFLLATHLLERSLGLQHPRVANLHNNLGTLEYQEARYPQAIERFERARAIVVKTYGESHGDLLTYDQNIGHALRHLRRCDEAQALFRRVLGQLERDASLRASFGTLFHPLLGLTACQLQLATGASAKQTAELARLIEHDVARPIDLAEGHLTIAEAEWRLGNKAAARAALERARQTLDKLGAAPLMREVASDIRIWEAAHRG